MSTGPRCLGKYELQQRLGHGGVAEVWKALDRDLQRYVAIKLLQPDLQVDPDFLTRFEREARVLAFLSHPNIVQVHDFHISNPPESEGTTAYMVMDYVEGETLADYIRRTSAQGKFPPVAEMVHLFAAIGSAVDYAHQRGMVHRDIKPANILLDKRLGEASDSESPIGEPVLTDFGIAKLMGTSTGAMSGSWLSTPLYISPEQVRGYPGNECSDVYSLGVILYEMCTGVPPFHGDEPSTIMMQHAKEPPFDPARINPHISPALSAVILRALAKDPVARFPSASSLTAALAEAVNVPLPERLNVATYPKDIADEPTSHQSFSTQLVAYAPVASPPPSVHSSSVTPSLTPMLPTSTPGPSTSASAQSPVVPLPPQRRSPLFIAAIVLLLLALVGGGLATFFLFYDGTAVPHRRPGGIAFFVSSEQWSEDNNQGIEDKLQIILHNIPDAASGKRYYAWLLNDKTAIKVTNKGATCSQVPIRTQALFLGWLPFKNGNVTFTYEGIGNTNLLAIYSRLLITEEDAQNTPSSPSSKSDERVYSAEIPQIADKVGKCFSALDYLRHLLSEGLQIQKIGIRGGLDARLLRNVQKVWEWASSASDAWRLQPDFIRRQMVRILDYVDGLSFVDQDVPARTPPLVDPQLGQVGIIVLSENQKPSGYLSRIDLQLRGINRAPGTTPVLHGQALQADKALVNVQHWLEQVRQDAKRLVRMSNTELSELAALSLLDDLETEANYAFVGRLDPSTGSVQAGAIQIHYAIQQLATFDIQPYKQG